jgi:ectoine hydroxylase-related dioxygenase (phytanoyl-CoA dioxygenase family)
VSARAGSIVVFSSLTPHSTGPNRTDQVRKAYIVQFAPDGARVIRPRADGRPGVPVPADEASRQYEVVRGGEPVASSAGAARDPSAG